MYLDNSRTSTVNPFGSTRWVNTPTFDQAGFDAAMAAYKPARPPTYGGPASQPWDATQGGREGNMGTHEYYSQLLDPGSPQVGEMPNRADYERNSWTNLQELSPESQKIYDASTKQLQDALGGELYNQKIADALFSRLRRFQAPEEALARDRLQTNLADRGFDVGSAAFGTEMDRLGTLQQQGIADAADRATLAGSQERQQLVQLLSNLRNQQVAGVSSMPTTTATPSVGPVPIADMEMAAYGDALDRYNAEQASGDNFLGSLLGLGGTLLGGPAGSVFGSLLGMGGGAGTSTSSGNAGQGIRRPRNGFWGY